MNPPVSRVPKGLVVFLAPGALAVLLAGCIIIPVDYYQTGSRRNLSLKTPNSLKPGVLTKERTFLTLGEPDFVSGDGQRMGYTWTKVKAIWAVAGNGSGASGEFERSYVLELCFDGSNYLQSSRVLKEWGSAVSPARELEAKP